MIAVTFALAAESSGFRRRLHNKTRSDRNGITTIAGHIDNCTVEVFHTGVGEEVCRQRTARFLEGRKLDCLISAGFAGALNDQLRIGDLLLAKNFSTAEVSGTLHSLANLPIHIANLLTVRSMIESGEPLRECRDRIVATVQRRLVISTRDCGALVERCVELLRHPFALASRARRLPACGRQERRHGLPLQRPRRDEPGSALGNNDESRGAHAAPGPR